MARAGSITLPGLAQKRRDALLTQAELGEIIGLSREAISHIEHGYRCRLSTAHKLADALHVEYADLIQTPEHPDQARL
jgi:DNA-binding XRE family transcriptional regulator